MNQEIIESIAYIARTRKLSTDFIVESLKEAIVSILKKKYGPDHPIEVRLDAKRGDLSILIEKEVAERVTNPEFQISLEEARKAVPDIQPGEKIMVQVPLESFGRGLIARIQNNFQQRIREAERLRIYRDFQKRKGELIKGRIWRVDKTGVYVQIGAEGIIPPEEQIPGEKYRINREVLAIILDVDKVTRRKPQVILSRTHPDFIRRLMEQEIPEVTEGTVEVRAVVRVPGRRAKVAVRSKDPRVDPVGACIGIRGTRIRPVVQELGSENIDIVRWYPDTIRMATSALSPVVPLMVFEKDDKIYAVVEDDKVADAKGKDGLNIILASRLVGKEIIVVPSSEYELPKDVFTVLELDVPPDVNEKLRKAGYFVFTDVPLLAELMERTGLDERTALLVLKKIEEGIEKKVVQ